MPRRSIIKGTGHYVPDRIVSNAELVAYVGGSAQWIEERTGIRERRWARASQTTSELGLLATKRALEDAGVEARELDALIFATLSADLTFPGCGVLLQDALGVAGLPALDVRNQTAELAVDLIQSLFGKSTLMRTPESSRHAPSD